MNVLMVDIGGSSVKTMVSDQEEMRKFPSGPTLTPKQMVAGVKAATRGWTFDASNQDGILGARRLWEGADYLAVPYGTTWRISKDGVPPATPPARPIASSGPVRKLGPSR